MIKKLKGATKKDELEERTEEFFEYFPSHKDSHKDHVRIFVYVRTLCHSGHTQWKQIFFCMFCEKPDSFVNIKSGAIEQQYVECEKLHTDTQIYPKHPGSVIHPCFMFFGMNDIERICATPIDTMQKTLLKRKVLATASTYNHVLFQSTATFLEYLLNERVAKEGSINLDTDTDFCIHYRGTIIATSKDRDRACKMIKDMKMNLPDGTIVFYSATCEEGWIFFNHQQETISKEPVETKWFTHDQRREFTDILGARLRNVLTSYFASKFINENVKSYLAPAWAGAVLYDLYD